MSKDKINQKVKGSKNVVIGINKGEIIKTERIVRKTEVHHDSETHITDQQAKEISDRVKEIAKILASGKDNPSKFYAREWGAFKDHFKVTSYKLLSKENFEEAIKWLQRREMVISRPKLRKVDNEAWKKKYYTAIWAKAKQLGMNHQDVYDFAYTVLNLRKPISSLKDMSDTRLKKLYVRLFNKR